ncbi:hypothetical protein F5I97DRAFT_1931736 [Phlebopus sp. FC_14]|nr:hypothetical protein F5I97DRAFT_1931736 [Phlebopus sp. FC_14]
MTFHFSFPDLPKVMAIRVKRRRTKRSAGENGPTPDEPLAIPSILSPALNESYSQEASSRSSTYAASGSSLPQRISEMAQICLPMLQSLVGVVPVAGTALGAAVGGLLSVLQLVDRQNQNKADLDRLARRLYQLLCHVANAPIAQAPLEHSRRETLITYALNITFPSRIVNEILGCFNDISNGLQDYLFSSQMEVLALIRHQQTEIQEMKVMFMGFGGQLRDLVPAYVTLIDATGRGHHILADQCRSHEQLAQILRGVLYQCTDGEQRVLLQYINKRQFEFCIDEGVRITNLTALEHSGWPVIQAGTVITMRAIFKTCYGMFGPRELEPKLPRICPFCRLDEPPEDVMVVDNECPGCGIQFQIFSTPPIIGAEHGEWAVEERDRICHNDVRPIVRSFSFIWVQSY